MKRTVFVSFIDSFGGVERLILSLSRFLHGKGIEHEVLCFSDTLGLGGFADWPLTVRQIPAPRKGLREAQALRRYWNSHPEVAGGNPLLFDLKGAYYAGLAGLDGFALHLTDPPSLLGSESSRSSAVYRRWAGETKPVSLLRRLRGGLVHWINRRGAKRAAQLLAMTNRIGGELKALYDREPRIIRPGVARARETSQTAAAGREKRIHLLSVSRLERSKRLDLAIRSLAELRVAEASDTDWVLDIAGAGPAREELEALALSLGVERQVIFHGRVSDEELDKLFQQTGVFVMPAVQGYGLPALEALQRRMPVVLHRESGVSEILKDSPWVEIIGDGAELAPALRMLKDRLREGALGEGNLPAVPGDDQWAEEIAGACGWLKPSK